MLSTCLLFLQKRKRYQEGTFDEDVESSQACPSMSYLFPGNANYAKDIRSPLANFVPTRTKSSNLVRKLHASDFQSNNEEHLELVKNMGINIISLPDGRVQLLHTLSNVNISYLLLRLYIRVPLRLEFLIAHSILSPILFSDES